MQVSNAIVQRGNFLGLGLDEMVPRRVLSPVWSKYPNVVCSGELPTS
jgi:hypothetical protein